MHFGSNPSLHTLCWMRAIPTFCGWTTEFDEIESLNPLIDSNYGMAHGHWPRAWNEETIRSEIKRILFAIKPSPIRSIQFNARFDSIKWKWSFPHECGCRRLSFTVQTSNRMNAHFDSINLCEGNDIIVKAFPSYMAAHRRNKDREWMKAYIGFKTRSSYNVRWTWTHMMPSMVDVRHRVCIRTSI